MTDADTMTIEDRRAVLERAIEHQRRLIRDARACGLRTLERRRRDRLRTLRRQMQALDGEAGGERNATERADLHHARARQ